MTQAESSLNKFGLPNQTTLEWIRQNSTPDEPFGWIKIPHAYQQGTLHIAVYEVDDCNHDQLDWSCNCESDPSHTWTFQHPLSHQNP